MPRKSVPYLDFLSDSSREVFHLIPEKEEKFHNRVQQTLECSVISVKSLQRLVGKCVSFSLAVPGALPFTSEMSNAISKALRTSKPIRVQKALRDEISHCFFLRTWNDPLPWSISQRMKIRQMYPHAD